jgi:hypothetical protein
LKPKQRSGRGAVTAKEKGVLVDSLQKQEDRDAQGRFLKGRSGNPEGRFRKGRSGNPKGRPAGARNKATQTAELLLDGEAEALTRRAVELALAGDGMALRLCLERIIPPRRVEQCPHPLARKQFAACEKLPFRGTQSNCDTRGANPFRAAALSRCRGGEIRT